MNWANWEILCILNKSKAFAHHNKTVGTSETIHAFFCCTPTSTLHDEGSARKFVAIHLIVILRRDITQSENVCPLRHQSSSCLFRCQGSSLTVRQFDMPEHISKRLSSVFWPKQLAKLDSVDVAAIP